MELRVSEYQLPEVISFNFDELKAELSEKVGIYETMVYTDDQIKVAKADKANLNKLKKALNDERIRREKEYMVPFNAFKEKVNEIIAIIEKPVAVIDMRVKEYEDIQKQKKLDEITEAFNSMPYPEWLHFSQIFDEKWLNASVSMKSVLDDITAKIEGIYRDLDTLAELPEFGFEATEVYKSTLDINSALSEGHRMAEVAKAKAEHVAKSEVSSIVQEEDVPKTWVKFQAYMSISQAMELKRFFDERAIEFKAV